KNTTATPRGLARLVSYQRFIVFSNSMIQVIQEENQRPIKIWTDDIDPGALDQLRNVSTLPFVHPHGVVAMPDVHVGIGATVGRVIATDVSVIPSAVGVEIGWRTNAVRLSLKANDLPDNLAPIRHQIEHSVPLGPGGRHKRKNMDDFDLVLANRLKDITRK